VIDVVWRTCKVDVDAQIDVQLKALLGVTQLDPSVPGYSQLRFEQRTTAAKNVYKQMDEQKKQEIQQLVEKYKVEGNEPEIQQR
jgi:CO dehydrogenase nickel-insertion accessory protein CooC1